MPVRDRVHDIFLQAQTKLDNFLGVATRAEPTAPATEGQKKLVVAVRAKDTGEAFSQVAALEISLDDFLDYRTEISEFPHI